MLIKFYYFSDPVLPKIDCSDLEESLAEDSIDSEKFSQSRLIVDSTDNETSLPKQDQKNVVNKSIGGVYSENTPQLKSASEDESPDSIEIITSPRITDNDVPPLPDNSDLSLESDSIEVLSPQSSSIASPSTHNSIEVWKN